MFELEYKEAYNKKKNQLESILELTNAINNNVSEEELYSVYNFILKSQTNVKRHLLILCGESSEIKSSQAVDEISIYQKVFQENGKEDDLFRDNFDEYFNIEHQGKSLAHVFLLFEDWLAKKEQFSFIKTISNIVLVAIENKKHTSRKLEKEALLKELEIAKSVQNMLFPKALPKNENLDMHATYIPHAAVGGDYYDYIQKSSTEYVICIADVSGKGVPAALLMSNFQATLRTLVRQNLNLREIVTELNNVAFENTQGEKFITAFIALLDLKRENLYYVNAGHNPPYYVDRDHNITSLKQGTTLLGGLETLPKVDIGKISLSDYSMLFSFTDGLTEVFNDKGVQMDEKVLENFLREEQTTNLPEFHKELLNEVGDYANGVDYIDDITILTCKFRFENIEFPK